MSLEPPEGWTLATLAEALKTRAVSPVEITRHCLARIEQHDGRVNAFITVLAKTALAAAARAETEIRHGHYRGPLHGVPYASKDLFLTRGVRTTGGSKVLNTFVPDYDATVVERLESAGAILLGKLNMHELAFGTTSVNPHYGAVRNPWDRGRITGGSSGGPAAAVVSGFAHLTLGSDTGGSIRIPAALCGLSGLKPTYGRVSRYGAYPLAWSMDHVGPLAASSRDLALAMNVMAGRDRRDPSSSTMPVPDYTQALSGDLAGLRLGVPEAWFFEHIDTDVRAVVEQALLHLEGLGASIVRVSLEGVAEASRAASLILFGEAAAALEIWHRTCPEALGVDVRARLEQAAAVTAASYVKALRVRRRVQGAFRRAFQHIDAVVTPQLPITAPLLDQSTVTIEGHTEPVPAALTRFTRIFNLTGLPALSTCCGFSPHGLPIGLQIAGRAFDEATILRIGDAYERHTSHHRRRPVLD